MTEFDPNAGYTDEELGQVGAQVSGLGCTALSLRYDFMTKSGVIEVPPLECVDMGGCTALFEKLDQDVLSIQTVSGGRPDARYRRVHPTSEWRCDFPHGQAY